MGQYGGFDTKEEYLRHTKQVLQKQGMKSMFFSVCLLMIMFLGYMDQEKTILLFPEQLFWFIQKFSTVCFCIGALGYLLSFTIKIEEILEDSGNQESSKRDRKL